MARLPEVLRRKLAKPDAKTINETIEEFSNVPVDIVVDVRLVGFDGSGAGHVKLSEHELYAYLQQQPQHLPTVALQPFPQELPFKPRLIFSVSHAPGIISHRLSTTIAEGVRNATGSQADKSHAFLDYTITNSVIHDDYMTSQARGQYTIYILNPLSTSQPYNYIYTKDFQGCPGQLFADKHKPFVWVDITAETAFYGPGPGGRGQVFDHSMPRLEHYRAEFMPAAIYPDIAALVWSACQHLIWPPLHYSSLPAAESLQIELVHMHNTLLHPPSNAIPADLLQAMLHHASGTVQNSTVGAAWLAFSKCEMCSAAYSKALKVRTARVPAASFRVASTHFLDSSELHDWLAEYRDGILADAGIRLDQGPKTRLLPVFIFDLSLQEPILLDGWRQAVAFDDMVIVVRTPVPVYAAYFQCNHVNIDLDLRNVVRPMLAAVAQSAWGVADTALHWSEGSGRDWNYIWSAGSTPFSPISSMAIFSFAQVDAAKRNLVLSSLNTSISYVNLLLRNLDLISDDGTAKSALPPESSRSYRQRINLFRHKLNDAMTYLSLREFEAAMIVARSLQFDVAALHKIMQRAAQESPVMLQCHQSNHEFYYLLPVGGVLVALAAVVVRHVLTNAMDTDLGKMF